MSTYSHPRTGKITRTVQGEHPADGHKPTVTELFRSMQNIGGMIGFFWAKWERHAKPTRMWNESQSSTRRFCSFRVQIKWHSWYINWYFIHIWTTISCWRLSASRISRIISDHDRRLTISVHMKDRFLHRLVQWSRSPEALHSFYGSN